MRASESPFKGYKSKRILFFSHLICASVSGPKALKKTCLRFAIFNRSEKLQNIFEIRLKIMCSDGIKIALGEKKISKEKIRRHVFVLYMLN